MNRLLSLVLTLTLLATAGAAAADRPAGTWRMTVELGGGRSVTVLLTLDVANGVWAGKCLGSTALPAVPNTIDNVRVDGDRLRFTLAVEGRPVLTFDGKV